MRNCDKSDSTKFMLNFHDNATRKTLLASPRTTNRTILIHRTSGHGTRRRNARTDQEVQPGGIIIFGRNVAGPEQLRSLLDGVRELVADATALRNRSGRRTRRSPAPDLHADALRAHDSPTRRSRGRTRARTNHRRSAAHARLQHQLRARDVDHDRRSRPAFQRSLFAIVRTLAGRGARLHDRLHARSCRAPAVLVV